MKQTEEIEALVSFFLTLDRWDRRPQLARTDHLTRIHMVQTNQSVPHLKSRSSSSVQHCVDGILNVGSRRFIRFPTVDVPIALREWDTGWDTESR